MAFFHGTSKGPFGSGGGVTRPGPAFNVLTSIGGYDLLGRSNELCS